MEEQSIKVRRSIFAIKLAMVLVFLNQVIAYYQTDTMDFGAIALTIGILALLRGLLLSPFIFNRSAKSWYKKNVGFNTDSYKYFALSIILIPVGLIRYL